MTSTPTNRLDLFAAEFVRDITSYRQVRSEALAEAVRAEFGLPGLPSLDDLRELCTELGIPIWKATALPDGVVGFNFSYGNDASIHLASDLNPAMAETTLCHELREVIENAFARVKPSYEARPTHDNRAMNDASDRFGGYLLMEGDAAHSLMAQLGYDLFEFSARTGRSLPSVLLRMQKLYSSKSTRAAPTMGAWLFDAPREAVAPSSRTADDIEVRFTAKLGGFSQRSGSPESQVFPRAGSNAAQFHLTRRAVSTGRSACSRVSGLGLTPGSDYVVVAEPRSARGAVSRILVTAVRADCLGEVAPWRRRIGQVPSERRDYEL